MKRILFVASLLFSCAALAAAPQPVGLAAGQQAGTSYALGKDIASVSQSMGQPVTVIATRGSIETLKMMSSGKASLGIVQSDVLGFLARSSSAESRKIANGLRVVLPLYREEVHVLARRDIHSMAELAGKRVVIGEEGSGNVITAINILNLFGVKPGKQIRTSAPEGVVSVLTGEADAMVFVGGAPVPLFDRLQTLKTAGGGKNGKLLGDVHFLSLKDTRLSHDYAEATITPAQYPFITEPVATVAVTAVLMAADASSGADEATIARCGRLEKVGLALRRNIAWLKRSGHPKWREVDFARTLPGWGQDMCSWREDVPAAKAPKSGGKAAKTAPVAEADPLHRELLDVLSRPRPVAPADTQPTLP